MSKPLTNDDLRRAREQLDSCFEVYLDAWTRMEAARQPRAVREDVMTRLDAVMERRRHRDNGLSAIFNLRINQVRNAVQILNYVAWVLEQQGDLSRIDAIDARLRRDFFWHAVSFGDNYRNAHDELRVCLVQLQFGDELALLDATEIAKQPGYWAAQ